jgi:hypothetical protein
MLLYFTFAAHLFFSSDVPASRLVGRLSYAHDGPILQALNLALGSTERHFIDRALSITGAGMIVVTPGAGVYHVDKHLLRLTTTRVLDQGFGIDLVCLAPRPLHQAPIFSFYGSVPLSRSHDPRAMDPLWGGDDRPDELADRVEHWWEPLWMSVSFWDRQMDLPFREDRFVARAKMHKIQMLGLLGHDVLSSIEIPYLKESADLMMSESSLSSGASIPLTKEDADKFDSDIFSLPKHTRPPVASRNSYASSTGGTVVASSYQQRRGEHRASVISTSSMRTIGPIEESPRRPSEELPATTPTARPMFLHADSQLTVKLSTSPSQISIRTVASARSSSSTSTTREDAKRSAASGLLKPLWFFNPFKVTPAKAEAVTVTAHAATGVADNLPSASMPIPSPSQRNSLNPRGSPLSRSPQAAALTRVPSRGSTGHTWEEDGSLTTQRARSSPVSASPRDSGSFGRRRSLLSQAGTLIQSAHPQPPTNPLRAQTTLPPAQQALARRWQHFGPGPWFKHEMKWKSLVMPGCLPLSVEGLPPTLELERAYDVFAYESFVDPSEVSSFLVRPPRVVGGTSEDSRRAFAYAVMHGMAAVRIAQGFQLVLRGDEHRTKNRPQPVDRTQSFSSIMPEDEAIPLPRGVATVRGRDTIYLSMSNEIHRISYGGDSIQVRRYVRKMTPLSKYKYECLIWPKAGVGYTEMQTVFDFRGLGDYGWNR